jgi:serine acetyltransferase
VGDNVIIGAGSVVTSDIPDNSVAVGVPCEVKISLEEYRNRRMEREKEDLQNFVEKCKERGVQVPEEIPQEYL